MGQELRVKLLEDDGRSTFIRYPHGKFKGDEMSFQCTAAVIDDPRSIEVVWSGYIDRQRPNRRDGPARLSPAARAASRAPLDVLVLRRVVITRGLEDDWIFVPRGNFQTVRLGPRNPQMMKRLTAERGVHRSVLAQDDPRALDKIRSGEGIHEAAKRGHLRSLAQLARDGDFEAINNVNLELRTPVQVAVEHEQVEFLRCVLEDPGFRAAVRLFPPPGVEGKRARQNTPLHEACCARSPARATQMVRYLLDAIRAMAKSHQTTAADEKSTPTKPAKTDSDDDSAVSIPNDAKHDGEDHSSLGDNGDPRVDLVTHALRVRDQAGMLPVHQAARQALPTVVAEFLRIDKSLDRAKDSLDRTPLHLVTEEAVGGGVARDDSRRLEVIQVILRHGAKHGGGPALDRDADGMTFLHRIVMRPALSSVLARLVEGAAYAAKGTAPLLPPALFVARDNNGRTPLLCACESGSTKTVRLVLRRGHQRPDLAEWNALDARRNTVLHLSCIRGGPGLLDLLGSVPGLLAATINKRNLDGDTPLHVALRYLNRVAVGWLLGRGADASLRNTRGDAASELLAGRESHIGRDEQQIDWELDTFCDARSTGRHFRSQATWARDGFPRFKSAIADKDDDASVAITGKALVRALESSYQTRSPEVSALLPMYERVRFLQRRLYGPRGHEKSRATRERGRTPGDNTVDWKRERGRRRGQCECLQS